ncbi:restriction endonuclease subunit S [Flavobacterium chungbukense]|uniref:Type I restriction modification DNA specificity domain-containing protein n=1 Tax=Flavobacterium chungbukense TaxID=877464 RepID=A0ABP7XVC3_9FLAO|nr:restriction endonuclease subunit S [Flavobacterium chungbukense]MCC4921595.1 restriction endonuclease subunit S [Flavobacterium chungbukense]
MKKSCKLIDVVSIRSGMVVSKTANNDENQLTNAYVRMIGTSDFDEDGNLRNDLEPNVLYKPSIEKNYLKQGEVVFNAKGRRFFAFLFANEYQSLIASASFLVLTIEEISILPEFLVWYLNHPETLKVFDSKMSTQVMPSITKQELGDLEIIIPTFETQKQIVALDLLKKKQIKLQKELITLEENYINAITYKKIKNGH